jgi:gamma-glutamyltranspeptidase/glutathione hydrolase
VSERIAFDWNNMPKGLGDASGCCKALDPDSVATWYIKGKPPVEGDVFRNPDLAKTFKLLQQQGPDAFYKGEIARAIVAKSKALGGVITMDDLADYTGEWVEPLTTEFLGWTFNEAPPPSQGWAGQLMVNILMACHKKVYPGESLDSLGPTDPRFWHLLIEAKKLAYADLFQYNSDPNANPGLINRIKALLTAEQAEKLGQKIQPDKALAPVQPPADFSDFGDTIVLTTADRHGNQVAWVNSLYWYFGSGLTVRPYGVTLGNRGALFSLDEKSANVIAPKKQPFTTICAGLVAEKAGCNLAKRFSLLLMGGGMQAQGHGQLMINLGLGANLQQAIDMARFYHDQVPNVVQLEAPIYDIVGEKLKKMGHNVVRSNSVMTGGAQMILSVPQKTAAGTGITRRGKLQRVLVGASDPRKDGQAVGY